LRIAEARLSNSTGKIHSGEGKRPNAARRSVANYCSGF
jgi:hypothetical protein